MISLYRMFQIIFGIIVSVLVLYFLIQYASNYAGFQEDVQRVTIIKNLKITAESVHTYGNPVDFNDTSLYDFSSCYMSANKPEPPVIRCGFGEVGPVLIPMLLSVENEVAVDRAELNFGWHVMHWAEVMPESRIIFTPMDSSGETWELMKILTDLLPSTENLDTKVTFGFCDGNDLMEDVCGGLCERYGFLGVLDSYSDSAEKCRASLSKKHRLITISNNCGPGFSDSGVCIRPPQNGVGRAYLSGSDKTHVYKDPLDIIALVIGGSGEDVFGKTGGERLYDYKNEVWGERLSLAAGIMKKRSSLLFGETESQDCRDIYLELAMEGGIFHAIQNLAEGDYSSEMTMITLAGKLREAKSLYQNLVDLGCEYYV